MYRGITILDSTRQVYNLGNGKSRAQGTYRVLVIQGLGELGTPHPCRMEAGAGSDHDGTRNMSRGVNLLYLFRY